MIKTITQPFTAEELENGSTISISKKTTENNNEFSMEPSAETILNILNYSRALKIKHSKAIGIIQEIAN